MTEPGKCFFFDRDGIVNAAPGPGYVERWEDFHILPEFVQALEKVTKAGYAAIVVTNQRCVARGIISEAALVDMHNRLKDELKQKYNLELLDIVYCPHPKDSCDCRKPQPGMLLKSAEKYNINLKASWMVGDQKSDIEAGKRAGCRTIYVSSHPERDDSDMVVADMKELVSALDIVLGSRT